MWLTTTTLCLLVSLVQSQVLLRGNTLYDNLKCPEHWLQYQESCYRFIKSPLRAYAEARKICQVYSYITYYI